MDRERRLDTQRWVTFAAEHPLLGYTYPDSMREVEGYTEAMKGTGVMLFVHTVNDPEEIAACYAEGFTGVYTDNVE